jgi:hypothetical protein
MGSGADRTMSSLKASEIEIVGFNGAPLVECGRSLPIAKRKSDGQHCVLDLSRGVDTLVWHSQEEAASFAEARQWTELERPVSVPNACVDTSTGAITTQPMLVFENETLLDVANRVPRPDHHDGQYLMWQALKGADPGSFAACASSPAVEAILDDWAEGLLKRFDAMIGQHQDQADLKRIADFTLCAARSRTLRWKAFVRYAAAQEPDRVKPTFDRFVHGEFPQVSWESFLNDLKTMRDVWSVLPPATTTVPVKPTVQSTRQNLRDIAQDRPLNLVAK